MFKAWPSNTFSNNTVLKIRGGEGHQQFLSQGQSIWGYFWGYCKAISRKLISPYFVTKHPRCVIQPQTCMYLKNSYTKNEAGKKPKHRWHNLDRIVHRRKQHFCFMCSECNIQVLSHEISHFNRFCGFPQFGQIKDNIVPKIKLWAASFPILYNSLLTSLPTILHRIVCATENINQSINHK
jgi:hypothetical protein